MKQIITFIKKNYLWIILILSLIIFMGIAEDVFEEEIMKIDVMAYNFLVEKLRTPLLTNIMTFITKLGNATTLILIVVIMFIIIKDKVIPACITGNLIIITLLNQILKYIVQRPRPDGYRLISESGYSFPSGHSMVSVAFFGYLIYLTYKYVKNKTLRIIIYIFLTTLITLICISRVYLGVHYASDVIGGLLISIAYLIIYITITKKYVLKK